MVLPSPCPVEGPVHSRVLSFAVIVAQEFGCQLFDISPFPFGLSVRIVAVCVSAVEKLHLFHDSLIPSKLAQPWSSSIRMVKTVPKLPRKGAGFGFQTRGRRSRAIRRTEGCALNVVFSVGATVPTRIHPATSEPCPLPGCGAGGPKSVRREPGWGHRPPGSPSGVGHRRECGRG